MKRIDFNRDWICRCLTRDEKEVRVSLPHDAMISEPRSKDSRGEGNVAWFIGGDYEYRKTFHVPTDWEDKALLIEFEGVYRNAEVWLNGQKGAYRPYGYTNFYVDIKGLLKYGADNEIRVIAHNSDQPNSRWYSGAGIYRPASLWLAEDRHILVNGIRVRTISIERGEIEVRVQTSAPGRGVVEIRDGSELVASEAFAAKDDCTCALNIRIPKVKLWDTEHPNLYTCQVRFESDEAETTFGVRALAWDEKRGLTLNGKRVILRGACVHHDNGLLGACAVPEAEERKVRILKENGYNALRSAHNPCSKAMLDACDRLGMLMMDEYVDAWYIHKTAHDYVDYLMDWWNRDLVDMVDKDYNHPCVVMYSTGNEVSETAQEKGIRLTGDMTRYLHELDGTRPVTCGINIFFNFLSSMGFGVYSDDKAQKNAEAAKKSGNDKKKAVGSEFYNRLACMMGDKFMKWGATLHGSDVKTRDAFANMDIAGYEEGGEAKPLVIEVHGGGFFGGKKETNTDHSKEYEKRGYAVVTPNYTHLPAGNFKNIVQEIFSVMHWVEANADTYHFDLNNVFMGGDSAGGFIVQLTAMVMTSEALREYYEVENPGFALRSIVLSCPEYNILALRDEIDAGNGFKSFMAGQIADVITDDAHMAHVDLISNLEAEGYPPVYIITTPTDDLLYEDAVALDSFLTDKGIEHEYHVYEGTENELGHVFNVTAVNYAESVQANDDCDAYLRSLIG